MFYLLEKVDVYPCEHIVDMKLLVTTASRDLIESLIKEYNDNNVWADKNFVDFMHEKDMDGNYVDVEEIILSEFDSS